MSKAFTKDDGAPEAILVPPRAPLPDGVANYVTPRGLRLLQEEMAALEAERSRIEAEARDAAERRRLLAAHAERVALLGERLASATLVTPAAGDTIRFGSTALVRAADGTERRYRITGVDEADPARGDVAFTSPIARALMGREPGDEAVVRTPRGEQVLEILSVEQDA